MVPRLRLGLVLCRGRIGGPSRRRQVRRQVVVRLGAEAAVLKTMDVVTPPSAAADLLHRFVFVVLHRAC